MPSDLYVLGLPLHSGAEPLAILAFLGGISAATGMVVMATLTLGIITSVFAAVTVTRLLVSLWLKGERARGQKIEVPV